MKKTTWLIIGILYTSALAGCSTSVSKKRLPSLAEVQKKNSPAELFRSEVAKAEVLKNESNEPRKNKKNEPVVKLDTTDLEPMPTGKRLPTLREQMQKITDEQMAVTNRQKELSEDVILMRQDVSQMKESLENIKNVLTEMRGEKQPEFSKGKPVEGEKPVGRVLKSQPVSGDILPDNVARETFEDDVIQPDDVPQKKVVKQSPPPAKAKIVKEISSKTPVKKHTEISRTAGEEKSAAPVIDKSVQQPMFQTAMSLFKKKDFSETITLLNGVLKTEKSPATQSNCHYWIGESYFGLGQYSQAISFFKKVTNFKNSEKSDDAQRMMAEAYAKGGNIAEARRAFQRLIDVNPESEFVPIARKRLQML